MNTQTLLSIVADQREELLANDYSELCIRPEESQLDLKSKRAQVVIGVRRCGKLTLCEMFLKQKGIEFANAANKLKCNNLTLVTFEEQEAIEEDGYTINIVPATKWLLYK